MSYKVMPQTHRLQTGRQHLAGADFSTMLLMHRVARMGCLSDCVQVLPDTV
jgi:hypothetical protein